MKTFISHTTFLAIIACILWSTAFAGVKVGLSYTSPLQFAGIRFFLSGLLIFPFAAANMRNYIIVVKTNFRLIIIISILQTVFQYSMFYLGMSMVPASLGAIIIGSAPLFFAMTAHFFMQDDRMTRNRAYIFLLGFSGVILVIAGRNDFTSEGTIKFTGIIFLLLTVIASAFANIFVSKDKGKTPPLILSSATMLIGGGILILFSIKVEGLNVDIKPPVYYLSLGWLSFLSAAAVSIWFVLLGRPGVKVSDLNFWKFLIPVSGAVLSWILIPEEKPVSVALAGMGIVALSMILLNINKRNRMRRDLRKE